MRVSGFEEEVLAVVLVLNYYRLPYFSCIIVSVTWACFGLDWINCCVSLIIIVGYLYFFSF